MVSTLSENHTVLAKSGKRPDWWEATLVEAANIAKGIEAWDMTSHFVYDTVDSQSYYQTRVIVDEVAGKYTLLIFEKYKTSADSPTVELANKCNLPRALVWVGTKFDLTMIGDGYAVDLGHTLAGIVNSRKIDYLITNQNGKLGDPAYWPGVETVVDGRPILLDLGFETQLSNVINGISYCREGNFQLRVIPLYVPEDYPVLHQELIIEAGEMVKVFAIRDKLATDIVANSKA
ncbi:MAG: hypothetical protein ABIG95_00565 [Candidatus Woesearchaeota archaeon]